MSDTSEIKRTSGQTAGSNWLVIKESTKNKDGGWTHKCGTEILATVVSHTIRDGLFALSGSGKVERIETPYCPKCEMVPGWRGEPITE